MLAILTFTSIVLTILTLFSSIFWSTATVCQTTTTHQLGGTLDAVITKENVGCPDRVEVVDVGLLDNHLLQ